MTDYQDLSGVRVAFKAQSALGTPATGASAFGLELLPSQGIAAQIASIESRMITRSRMRRRPRHGPKSVTASYERELCVRALDEILEAVLGGTWVAEQSFSNTDWGNVVISGTGVTATFASGTLITDGIVAGMMIKFTNLSTSGNNAVWVPILQVVSETVLTLASGYILDNADDAAYSVKIARYLKSTVPYRDQYFSGEEYMPDTGVDMSKYITDARFNSLNISIDPNEYTKIGFGLGARTFAMKNGVDAPVFTNPVYNENESLILLDGGIYLAGTKRSDLTGVRMGLAAPVSSTSVIGARDPLDVSLGEFAFTGDFTGAVTDDTDFSAFDAEDDISMLLHCKEKSTQSFISFYAGFLSYAGYGSPAGGEGPLIQSIPLYGGADLRGAGYAPTTILVSTSAAA